MTNTIGEKIRTKRKEKGFTLEKLAELTDSSKSYIWELENRTPPRPSADKLTKIAAQLDVTLDYLLDTQNKISELDAADAHFFREYNGMSPETRKKIRKMAKVIKGTD